MYADPNYELYINEFFKSVTIISIDQNSKNNKIFTKKLKELLESAQKVIAPLKAEQMTDADKTNLAKKTVQDFIVLCLQNNVTANNEAFGKIFRDFIRQFHGQALQEKDQANWLEQKIWIVMMRFFHRARIFNNEMIPLIDQSRVLVNKDEVKSILLEKTNEYFANLLNDISEPAKMLKHHKNYERELEQIIPELKMGLGKKILMGLGVGLMITALTVAALCFIGGTLGLGSAIIPVAGFIAFDMGNILPGIILGGLVTTGIMFKYSFNQEQALKTVEEKSKAINEFESKNFQYNQGPTSA